MMVVVVLVSPPRAGIAEPQHTPQHEHR